MTLKLIHILLSVILHIMKTFLIFYHYLDITFHSVCYNRLLYSHQMLFK